MSGLAWELVCVECQQSYAGDAFRYRCTVAGPGCTACSDSMVSLSSSISDLAVRQAPTVPESGGFANCSAPRGTLHLYRGQYAAVLVRSLLNMQGSSSV